MNKKSLNLALGLCLAVAASASWACDRSPLLVRNVGVWSPEGIEHRRDVLIADGRVKSVTPSRRGRAPAGTRVIEGRGAVMLPGLIDSHLHLSYGGWRPAQAGDHRWGSAAFTGPQNLSAGVTNGRIHLIDIKTGSMLRADSQDDCAPLPRLQAGGPAFIPGAASHYDGVAWTVTSVDDAIDRVRREKAAGFEWIALHEFHAFTPEQRDAIVRTARENGLKLLGSGWTPEDVQSSLAAGADTIDYIETTPNPEYAQSLLDAARARPALVWVARLGVHARHHAYQQNPSLADSPLNYAFVPATEVPALRAWAQKELTDGNRDYSSRMAATYPTLRRKFQQLRNSGILLAAGTDAGSPTHAHSDAIWWEMRTWVEYGATPVEALKAVTVSGARVLGRDDLGHLRPGAVGDFLLYTGDVSNGEFDVTKVTHVTKGGVLFVEGGRWVGPGPPN
jgi:imidazolonepropionase-like amidohydrolase